MATDGPTPPPCDPKLFSEGSVVFVTSSIGSCAIERWVKDIAEESGQPVDWSWHGGRAVILALGDLDAVCKAITKFMPVHDELYRRSVSALGPHMECYASKPPRPSWWHCGEGEE